MYDQRSISVMIEIKTMYDQVIGYKLALALGVQKEIKTMYDQRSISVMIEI